MCVFDRVAPGLRIDAAALEARRERLAHGEVEALIGARGLAARALDPRAPDTRHVAPRRQRPTTFERGDAGARLPPRRGILGQCFGQPRGIYEISALPRNGPHHPARLRHTYPAW